ncbi:MAG: nuclear transport factor 2 family protein [Eudoraea sp.]|nr:nuclear transport factor 2 family protein [Eudoraea sp.]
MDSIYFTAYNSCDMATQEELFADDLEFYHDIGGLSTSKQDILNSIEENICGKVTRELVEGSIEVYPIHAFGAVEIGMHKFYNNQEPDAISIPSKFITIWKQQGDNWRISRVISLHN